MIRTFGYWRADKPGPILFLICLLSDVIVLASGTTPHILIIVLAIVSLVPIAVNKRSRQATLIIASLFVIFFIACLYIVGPSASEIDIGMASYHFGCLAYSLLASYIYVDTTMADLEAAKLHQMPGLLPSTCFDVDENGEEYQ